MTRPCLGWVFGFVALSVGCGHAASSNDGGRGFDAAGRDAGRAQDAGRDARDAGAGAALDGGVVIDAGPRDVDAATSPTCGDGHTDPGEVCDGADVNGLTCATAFTGFRSGTLGCRSDCAGYALSGCTSGHTCTAASVSFADVQAAYDACADGDTVVIPAGAATWTSTLHVDKAIAIVGAGPDMTRITGGPSLSLFSLEPSSDKPVRLSGIRFDLVGYESSGGNYPIAVSGSGSDAYALSRIRIDHCYFEKGQFVVTFTEARVYGVIDHCTFHNPDMAIQLNGSLHTWSYPITAGTTNAMVIEDDTFIQDADTFQTEHQEFISSGHGVRFVVRHDTFDCAAFTGNCSPYENHGQGTLYTGTSDDLRGPPIFEIYDNVFAIKVGYRFIEIRGGSCLVYNNTMTSSMGAPSAIQVTEDFELRTPPEYTTWAGTDQIENSFFWNNTLNGSAVTDVDLYDPSLTTFIQEGRDYFMHPPDTTSGKVTWTDHPGGHAAVFTPGVQAYFPYVPLAYPHPLVAL